MRSCSPIPSAAAKPSSNRREKRERRPLDARREARERILRAQRGVYEQVRSFAQDQLNGLVGVPAAKDLNTRLASVARDRLGAKATVEVSKSGVGVIAVQGQRRIDLSCDTLVERELAELAPRIEELWS